MRQVLSPSHRYRTLSSASDGDDTGRRIRRSSESTSQVVTNTSGLDGSKTGMNCSLFPLMDASQVSLQWVRAYADRSDSIVVRSESMASVPVRNSCLFGCLPVAVLHTRTLAHESNVDFVVHGDHDSQATHDTETKR